MASIFKNKFFSVAGQKERLSNAGTALLKSVLPTSVEKALGLDSTKIKANTGSAVANKVVEYAANHPFQTAAVSAIAAKPKVALAAGKEVVTAAKNFVTKGTAAAKEVVGKPVVQATAASLAANKISSPGTNTIILPGQPTQGNNNPNIVLPGQAQDGGAYALPSGNGAGSPLGSNNNGAGLGGATDYVLNTLTGKDNIVGSMELPGMPGGIETIDNTSQFITGGKVGQPTNFGSLLKPKGTTSRKKKKKFSKKTTSRKKKHHKNKSASRPSHKKKQYGTAKQYARKGGLKVHTAKNGAKYIILKSGKARFVKK